MFFLGITHWPRTWKSRIQLLSWALFALVVTYGIVEPESSKTKTNTIIVILAYKGNVIARLTYPARSKSIDTFSDLLELPDEATVGTFRFSSMNEILQETSDPTLKERRIA